MLKMIFILPILTLLTYLVKGENRLHILIMNDIHLDLNVPGGIPKLGQESNIDLIQTVIAEAKQEEKANG